MEKRWMKKHSGVAGTISKEVRDAKVGLEAIKRGGKNVNLKGVVHEIMVKDNINLNPKNIITGTRAYLTKSSTAVRDDIIVKRAGHVIRRFQLKDTPASMRKTLKQVSEGKYAKTGLMGTKETTHAYNAEVAKKAVKGIKIAKKMQSSGVSSTDTACIASKMLGKIPSVEVIAFAAKRAGVVGAAVSVGVAAYSSASDLRNGKITRTEYLGKIAKEGVGGGLSAAAGTAVATVTTAALAAAAAPELALVGGIAVATLTGIAVKKGYDLICDKGYIFIRSRKLQPEERQKLSRLLSTINENRRRKRMTSTAASRSSTPTIP